MENMSSGTGNRTVEFFSNPMALRVCKSELSYTVVVILLRWQLSLLLILMMGVCLLLPWVCGDYSVITSQFMLRLLAQLRENKDWNTKPVNQSSSSAFFL